MSKQTFVAVGASLAGAKAAEELRERGFEGHLGVGVSWGVSSACLIS
jgi:hypothetical protein